MLASGLALVAALALSAASAQDAQPTAGDAEASTPEPRGRNWFAFPILFWLPETKVGAAATGGLHFRLDGSPRASSLFLVAGYTMERQGSVDLAADVYLRGGALLTTRFRAVHYPDAFYGLGADTSRADREPFTRRFLELNGSAEFPAFGGRLRAGPRLNGRVEEIRDLQPGGVLEASGLPGVDGFRALGLGLNVTWDSRDHPLWPGRGAFAQASYVRYPDALSTDGSFGKGSLDLRLFRPLGADRVLGLGFVLENADGAAPFSLLSRLGSSRFFRGYREGRFRDRLSWATQAEVRVPLAERVSGVVFGAAGDVGENLASLRADTIKVSAGVGARFRLTREGATLRLDLAAGDEGPELYVLLLEAL
jgi:hypothetical protein